MNAARVGLFLLLVCGLAFPSTGKAAGLVISAPDISASPGDSGSFLVLLTDTDPSGSTPYNINGNQFELMVSGPAPITFTNVTTATAAAPYNTPYIYANSTANDYGLPLYTAPTNPFPTTDFTAADTYNLAFLPGYTTLNPGDTYALGLVSYTIDPTAAPGSVDILSFVPDNTLLSDSSGNSLTPSITDGSITVSAPSPAVPEPASWAMGMIAVVAGSLIVRSRPRTFSGRNSG